jgi:hypothetical protein
MDELLVEAIRDNIQKYGYSLDPVDLLQNVKAALVDEGWKSGERVNEQLKAWLNEFVTAIKDKDNLLPGRAGKIEGKILDAVREQERTRIVGLFDAAYKEWSEDKIENIYEEYQHIIDGLRK